MASRKTPRPERDPELGEGEQSKDAWLPIQLADKIRTLSAVSRMLLLYADLTLLLDDPEAHEGVVDGGASTRLPYDVGVVVAGEGAVALLARAERERLETRVRVFAADHPIARHDLARDGPKEARDL